MSAYWTILMEGINVKLKFSIVYYPQTDNQTKQNNQMLEQ